jgi:hypothetical protein
MLLLMQPKMARLSSSVVVTQQLLLPSTALRISLAMFRQAVERMYRKIPST